MGNTQEPMSSVVERLITKDNLQVALHRAKGPSAQIISWTIKNFTAKGDNYVSILTGVEIKYQLNDTLSSVSFIAKLGVPQINQTFCESMNHAFLKECNVYDEIMPLLNKELISHGLHRLRVPECYYAVWNPGNQIMYLEDLRSRGFQTYDNKKPLDTAHATIVVKEIARLHAVSLLIQRKIGYENIDNQFPYLNKDCFDITEDVREMAARLANKHIEETIIALKEFEGYQKAIQWLTDLKPQAYQTLMKQLDNETKFSVFCHGDFWIGNLLFRYDDQRNPVEVMLIDLQQFRQASLAIDLKLLFYHSLTGYERASNLAYYLDIYHESFKNLLDSVKLTMPFTREELLEEYKSKHFYGCFWAMSWLPSLLSENEDNPFDNYAKDSPQRSEVTPTINSTSIAAENTAEDSGSFLMTDEEKKKFLLKFKKYPDMTARFLSLFTDIIEGDVN